MKEDDFRRISRGFYFVAFVVHLIESIYVRFHYLASLILSALDQKTWRKAFITVSLHKSYQKDISASFSSSR